MAEAEADISDIGSILGHSPNSNSVLLSHYASISDRRKKSSFERYHIQ